jgi:hypothetical protein
LDEIVKVVKTGTVELAYFFELLFQELQFQLRQIFVQILGYALSGWAEDRVPIFSVVVAREG